ncbi:Uma2 family endonuclease [Calothrix sp. 336/3]|uniref:Uma2 family endonuclease n=1 Tax=Calothrix sp. 336/3 TaxID=1337936 RepID=UPI0004E2C900|nr:Uma2 family endonuclease [Calothrix sp. 336/3]AKG22226.1 hypothetical protein IJ00_14000 [Calothrix sp. 336/3]
MSLSVKNLLELQKKLRDYDCDFQMELSDGRINLMEPVDVYASEIGAEMMRLLGNWVKPRKLGRVLDSGCGYILPNKYLKAPHISFIRAQRLKQSPRYFARIVPDLVIEIKAHRDRLEFLEEKIQLFLQLGTQVGVLIDADILQVKVYHPTEATITFNQDDTLTLPQILPGLEVAIANIFPPIFD